MLCGANQEAGIVEEEDGGGANGVFFSQEAQGWRQTVASGVDAHWATISGVWVAGEGDEFGSISETATLQVSSGAAIKSVAARAVLLTPLVEATRGNHFIFEADFRVDEGTTVGIMWNIQDSVSFPDHPGKPTYYGQ